MLALTSLLSTADGASNVNISTSATTGGAFAGTNPRVYTPTAASANIANTLLQTHLNSGSLTINTASSAGGAGDLTFAAPVSKSSVTASTLTLNVVRDLTIGAGLTCTSGSLPLVMNAGRSITLSQTVTTNSGNVTINTPTFSLNSTLNAGSGQIALQTGTLQSTAAQSVTGQVQVASGATWKHRGSISGQLNVAGVLSPGATTGSIAITGALNLQSTARTEIEIAGAVSQSNYDNISVSGAATVGGALQLSFLNGFERELVSGQIFTILTAGSITGTFASLPNNARISLPNGAGTLKINYSSTTITLSDWQPVITELNWDPGTAANGSQIVSNTTGGAGRYYFHINAQVTDIGAWRTRLTVTSGEAHLYLRSGSFPQTIADAHQKSEREGSDALVLRNDQYSPGQDWYIMVVAEAGAQWSLFTGRAWVQDLGTLRWTDANGNGVYNIGEAALPSGSGAVTIPIERIYFMKTVVPAGTPAWSLWLNGEEADIAVRRNAVPFHTAPAYYDRKQSGQMLVVPPYLAGTATTYFISTVGETGDPVNLDSRIQEVTDVGFDTTQANVNVNGAPYRVYRVQVPVQQIAWDVSVAPLNGNPNIAVRRDNVPAEFDNDGFSEVSNLATDSITLVPDFLTDATWFITVYGNSGYTFNLRNGPPMVTPLDFNDTLVNDQPTRAGWRFYAVTDIATQLGSLGWELTLANQIPGTEIAIRRNAVPSRWRTRTNGLTAILSNGRVDDFGAHGFLQRPAHQADIWYVGIYMPTAELGAFTLNSFAITPPERAFDGGTLSLVDVPPGRWEFIRVNVPAHALGWDVRLRDVTGTTPQLEVRRDELPTTGVSAWTPSNTAVWPSGFDWLGGVDWTGYQFENGGNVRTPPRLVAGMGHPLEAGTYYVGVQNTSSSPVTYTFDSRGIGSGLTYPVTTLEYNSVTQIPNIPAREANYFKVTIPPNTRNWELVLTPSAGQMVLHVRRGSIPDFSGTEFGEAISVSNSDNWAVEMQKTGPERYVMLPRSGEDYLPPADYYIAVVSEGGIPIGSVIGSGGAAGQLTSGPLTVKNLGVATSIPIVEPVVLAGGQIKAYEFTVPNGASAVELQLENRTGNPWMSFGAGTRLPVPPANYNASAGTQYGFDGGNGGTASNNIITMVNPAPGVYSILVRASRDANGSDYPNATADLIVKALTPEPVSFDGGTSLVQNQRPGSWRFFRVEVPAGANGWDVRCRDITGPAPFLEVRRDALPFKGSTAWSPSISPVWPSGADWDGGVDWTGRALNASPANQQARARLVAGMGRPLEPGLYFIGVYNDTDSGESTSYTFESRGIGLGRVLPVQELSFAGGSAAVETLLPREARYFKVSVPSNMASWEVTLSQPAGEFTLLVRRSTIPDFNAAEDGEANTPLTTANWQIEMQKIGPERYIMLPQTGSSFLQPGDYYLAVVSEGVNPSGTTIGTGASSGVLTSHGVLPVTQLGEAGPAPMVTPVSLVGAQVKAYQFVVPPGTQSLECRLENHTGNPWMSLVWGSDLPAPAGRYNASGDDPYGLDGGKGGGAWANGVITGPNPLTGVYSLIIRASRDPAVPKSYPDATADLVITALAPQPLPFDGGAISVSNQQVGTWRYFRVVVPPDAKGWDIRLRDHTGPQPLLKVRRDVLPDSQPTSWQPSISANWPSGNQWEGGVDWTGYTANETAPALVNAPPRIVAGMGRPLEPGTYFVGVMNTHATTPISYTVDSRGIGASYTYPVTELSYVGGTAAISDLPRREARYFKVTIPENAPSWEVTLNPTNGEMEMLVRRAVIPDFNAVERGDATGAIDNWEVEMQKAGPERYVMLPPSSSTTLLPGDYYIAAVSEGVNPGGAKIGTGVSHGVITSVGPLAVTQLGSATPVEKTTAVDLAGGQIKAYQVDVPVGTHSLEVRLDARVANPWMSVIKGGAFGPPPSLYNLGSGTDYGFDGGKGTPDVGDRIITIVDPAPGPYTILVRASRDPSVAIYPDASARLTVLQKQNTILNFGPSLNGNGFTNTDSRQMIDSEYQIYQVHVPQTLDGQPVIGWIIKTNILQGAASLQVYKDFTRPTSGLTINNPTAVIVPPYLTLGETWYVRVKATGITQYTFSSHPVLAERAPWSMPSSFNQSFGDSGRDLQGQPLPGDQGRDLAQGEWHFYALDIPEGNAGLLRTELQALSGNPDLYIREDGVAPTTDHTISGTSGTPVYQRSLTGLTTEYGNWTPFDGRVERQLRPGRWYLGVKAAGASNSRYRLLVSTGTVIDASMHGASLPNQAIAGNDWIYYRFAVPEEAPQSFTLTFAQEAGDVVLWMRDGLPPGQSSGNGTTSLHVESWQSDAKNQGPYSANGHDTAGAYTFTTPPIRPGQVLFAGFRSNNTATFSFTTSASSAIPQIPAIAFYGGTVTTTVPANGSVLYKVPVPADATRFKYTSTHALSVSLRWEQGTLPGLTGNQHLVATSANSSTNQALNRNAWPWQPAQTYYVRAVNSSATPQSLTINLNGKNAQTEDEDADGMLDAWELLYFPNLGSSAAQDSDNDGNSNLTEFNDGTNPASQTSAKYTLSVQAINGVAGATPAQAKYDRGSVVTLSNTPDPGHAFQQWVGGPFRNDDFAVQASGRLIIPVSGTYTFGIHSSDGARLKINGVTVINDTAVHGPAENFGQVTLAAGSYPLELVAFERTGGEGLELFAAAGSYSSFNSTFRLVGDVAEGGLAVELLDGTPGVPGFTVRQVEALVSQVNSLLTADNLLAGTLPKRREVTVTYQTLNFLSYDLSEGRFAENTDFPLRSGALEQPLSLTMLGNYSLSAINAIPLGAALDAPALAWKTGSNAPWVGQLSTGSFDGVDCAGSGPIGDNESSEMRMQIAGPGTLTFYWKVSSQSGDNLACTLNGSQIATLTGEVAWTQRTLNIPAGLHTVGWNYIKNASGAAGSDRGWVDAISFTSTAFSTWATGASLAGANALPETDVEGDGVSNLEEFAFNLPPQTPSYYSAPAGSGVAGLPLLKTVGVGSQRRLAIEFVRRKAGALVYTVQFADALSESAWETSLANATVTSIDANWERVVVEDLTFLEDAPARFGRVLLIKP